MRIENLQNLLEKDQAVLILSPVNRLYFTGFKSSAGNLIITKNRAVFLIDFRYYEKAVKNISHLEVLLLKKTYSQIMEILKTENIKTLFLETDYVNLDLNAQLKQNFENIEISTNSFITQKIREFRMIKTEKEIELISKAQNLTDKTFSHILNFISLGKSEKEIALEMEFFMRKNGSEGVAFDIIAISGKNTSLPHGSPTDKLVENGDFVTLDFGAVACGYRSDMTRTIAVGYATDRQIDIYNTVLSAQEKALDIIKPGLICKEIDKVARDVIENKGFGENFGHGLGHSVGLEIHENPAFNTKDETPLQKGMVITVEPGIYIEDEFGVRIEDMVAISDTDYVNLTKSDKNLIIL